MKVEVDILSSPSRIIVHAVSVDVNQHWTNDIQLSQELRSCVRKTRWTAWVPRP